MEVRMFWYNNNHHPSLITLGGGMLECFDKNKNLKKKKKPPFTIIKFHICHKTQLPSANIVIYYYTLIRNYSRRNSVKKDGD